MGQQSSPTQATKNGNIVTDEQNDRIIVSVSGATSDPVPNSIYGLQPDGTVALVIAKTGVNVFTLFS